MSLGPRILGRATDLIFAGVLGKQLADRAGARRHHAGAGRRGPPAGQGDDKQASMIASMKDFVVGQGVDFTAVGHVLLLVLARVRRGVAAGVAPGLPAQRRRPGHRSTGCAPTSRTRSTRCR